MATRDRTEYNKQYYQKNKDKILEQKKSYNNTDPKRKSEYDKEYRKKNKPAIDKRNYLYAFKDCNVTEEDYDHYLSVTHCEVCGEGFTDKNKKCQDHCHITKVLRSVICNDCNTSEGKLKSSDRAFKLYEYMQRNENKEH